MSGYQQKRKYNQQDGYTEAVDDLTFAAGYAIVTTPDVPPEPTKQNLSKGATDDIQIEEDTSDESSDDGDKTEMRSKGDEDSGDESDIDLSEQLAKMEKEDQPKPKNSRIVVPTTQNEIDLYNCPVADLEKKLELDLGISDVLLFHPSNIGIMNAKVSLDRIRLAGNITFHLASERTIVVESNPNGGAEQMGGHPFLLDEGSLLLLRLKQDDKIMSTLVGDVSMEANETCVIPLGKILEVFGPVSKPLYTIRLTKSLVQARQKSENKATEVEGEEKVPEEANEEGGDAKMDAQVEATEGEGEEKVPKEANEEVGDAKEDAQDESKAETPKETAKEEVESEPKIPDPWSKDGLLTQWIKSVPRLEVYYSEDQVKMMDTQSIVRNSRKACDASNLYDEEVTDTKEMYFSDDEQERMAKRGNKKKNQRNSSDNGNIRQGRDTGNVSGRGRGNPMHSRPYQPQQQHPQFPHGGGYHPGMAGAGAPPPPQQYHQQQQYPGHVPQPYGGPPPGAAPNYPMYAPPAPPQNGMYMNQMQMHPPPASFNNIPPPPPPPRQPYHNANSVPQQQMNPMYPPAPQYQQQQQTYPQQQYQQQQQQYQQPQQPGQGNASSNPSNDDTVYYNYSGS